MLGHDEQRLVLGDKTKFASLVRNERARWAVLQAARKSGLDLDPKVNYLMKRSAEQVLVDSYVKLRVAASVPDDFPGEDQVRQFYEQNRSRYWREARVPVWQIFFEVPKSAGDAQARGIEMEARKLAAALRAGEIDFFNAASTWSAHEASRLNGGFMGNLEVDDLIPEVKAAIIDAKPYEILDPVRSAAGLHILRRGETIAGAQLSLEQARDQVLAALKQAAETKARQAVISGAREAVGGDPNEGEIESWRSALSGNVAEAPSTVLK